jgi:RNA polymerase sigma-70 factor, ECF subfamily
MDAARTVEQLFREHAQRALRLAVALVGNEHDAEDVLQNAAAVALRKAPQRREPPDWPWLAGVIANEGRNFRRVRARREKRHKALPMPEPAAPPNTDDAELRELAQQARRELDHLPEAEREAIALVYVTGLSVREAAEAAGTAPTTLAGRAQRGIERLRQRLNKDGKSVTLCLPILPVREPSGGLAAAVESWLASGALANATLAKGTTTALTGWWKLTVGLVVLAALGVGAYMVWPEGELRREVVPQYHKTAESPGDGDTRAARRPSAPAPRAGTDPATDSRPPSAPYEQMDPREDGQESTDSGQAGTTGRTDDLCSLEEWLRLAKPRPGREGVIAIQELQDKIATCLARAPSFEIAMERVIALLTFMYERDYGWAEVAVAVWRGIPNRSDQPGQQERLLTLLETSENPAVVNALAPAIGRVFYRTDHARALAALFTKALHFAELKDSKYAGLVVGNCHTGYANVSKDLVQPMLLFETLFIRADGSVGNALNLRLFSFCVDSLGRVLQGDRLGGISETGWSEAHRLAVARIVERVNRAGAAISEHRTMGQEAIKALAALQHEETKQMLDNLSHMAATEDAREFYKAARIAWEDASRRLSAD